MKSKNANIHTGASATGSRNPTRAAGLCPDRSVGLAQRCTLRSLLGQAAHLGPGLGQPQSARTGETRLMIYTVGLDYANHCQSVGTWCQQKLGRGYTLA
ncbi:hypothetical protein RRG08_001048 [Elysia crispata]|uniref:Uncharacterized protein n=1 Tax=Elysia crispata TaxID=231223 RepID=A0AAE1AVQ2_9GAST|nr:hypothetical protein RRG08_001048 [Elysia crispata]